MATAARGRNEPPPQPIIVKKIIQENHDAHHGGAWKIAYADFVTAMMAFFLLLWLIGAVDEQKRKGLADYFTPTVIEYKQNSAGATGIMGGDSIIAESNYPHRAQQTGSRSIVIPRSAAGGPDTGSAQQREQEMARFAQLRSELMQRMEQDPQLRSLMSHISFTQSDAGLRIDLVDEADFSMFEVGTNVLRPQAARLLRQVAQVIQPVSNQVVVRGHTDSRPYTDRRAMNNWMLSTARAETTRTVLEGSGVPLPRFTRIEGVADREPYVAGDRFDPRNRRISITLLWADGQDRSRPIVSATAEPRAAGSGRRASR
ncbi:MAG TPA: flagellar motor protein MotB [Allosphingosinicella sp.]